MANAATPPTTPPAIAPTGVDDAGVDDEGLDAGLWPPVPLAPFVPFVFEDGVVVLRAESSIRGIVFWKI